MQSGLWNFDFSFSAEIMMKTDVIYQMESANENRVILWREGIFWRAYQRSAWFVVRDLKKCVPLKKWVKKIDAELVYIGFPDSGLSNLLMKAGEAGFRIEEQVEERIVISGFEGNEGYETWVAGIPSREMQEKNERKVVAGAGCGECPFREIMNWSLATLTPMEVMVKLSALQTAFRAK